jgi:hypothetical protein
MDTNKENLLLCLGAFIRQRPGLEFGNYGDVAAYRAESRSITKDLHIARELLRALELRPSITADALLEASQRAFSGRLSIIVTGDSVSIDYCTGQYFPTEYRAAVASIAASALWSYYRDSGYDSQKIRQTAKRNHSRAACQYFN